MKKIVFLVSGNGGSLKFVNEYKKLYNLPIRIVNVIADRECNAINYAKSNRIDTTVLNLKKDYGFLNLKTILIDVKPDLIITNIHKIIPSSILNLYPDKFLNLHYSLLPSFKGLIGMKTIDKAKELNVKFIGSTTHIIDEFLDEGTIVSQSSLPVNWETPINKIYNDIFQSSCYILVDSILKILDIKMNDSREIFNLNQIFFNPFLDLNINLIDDLFWKKLQ